MTTDYSLAQLRSILPHRLPLLDLARRTDDTHFVALKNVSMNEPFFQGHFPHFPIMPGVLQLEAMKQLAELSCFEALDPDNKRDVYLARAERVKFRRQVIPGDRARIEAEVVGIADGEAHVRTKFFTASGLASEATLFLKARTRSFNRTLPEIPGEFDFTPERPAAFDINKIMSVIPHRYPFLLVDSILEMNESGIKAIKNITLDEPFFLTADTAYPVLPESILCEIAAQAGCASVLSRPENTGKIGVFMAIEKAESFFAVGAGDQLLIRSTLPPTKAKFGRGNGEIVCNGEVAFSIQMMFAIIDA